MPDRKRIHIVPNGEDWVGQREGGERPSFHAATKTEAIERGREFAQREHGELIIHRKDGQIQEERTYRRDPHPPRG